MKYVYNVLTYIKAEDGSTFCRSAVHIEDSLVDLHVIKSFLPDFVEEVNFVLIGSLREYKKPVTAVVTNYIKEVDESETETQTQQENVPTDV